MQNLLPKCDFLGVDPVYEAGVVYEKIGRFIHAAIGPTENATIEASVFKNQYYVMRNVTSITFRNILEKINTNIIDFLLLDAEGAEYAIIPDLIR